MPRRTKRPPKSHVVEQPPLRQLHNPYPPFEVLSADQIEAIHESSLRVLAESGLQVVSDKARRCMLEAGATLDPKTGLVLMERGLVEQCLATMPAEFTLHGRNSRYASTYGGAHINFSMVSSPPHSSDIKGGRRTGNFADYCDFLRLGQSFNCIALFAGYPVEPVDLPPETRHLDAYLAFIELTEKPWHVYSLGRSNVEDGIEMNCLARGISRDELAEKPGLLTVINTNSPRKLDGPMAEGLMRMAALGQPVVVTPFTLAGAMSPITLAGALVQQNAEALGVMSLTQMVRPGAPVFYGGFTSNVDMRSGAPAFGTPEYAKAVLAGGQLARRYKVPYRTSNVNTANLPDAQSAWESQNALWSAVLGYGNLIKHGAGWLEGGLCASFEKAIMDMEMIQMIGEFLQPLEVSPEDLAVEAIAGVPPGGHFFGEAHTLARYEKAFYPPLIADWSNFETWQERGSLDAAERAHQYYKAVLDAFTPPPLDPGIREALQAYVARRRGEISVDQ